MAPNSGTATSERQRQGLLTGAIRVLGAELLVIPTGILTVAFLTRRLGPSGYGMLAIAAAYVDWLEWAVTASFNRATVKFISEADDWRPVASRSIQLQFLTSAVVGAALALLSGPIALLMNEPELGSLLRLYAIDLPVFCLAQAHRDVLVGLGYYRERAIATAWRWVVRLALIVLLVSAGMSVEGAIIGGIASSLVELAVCRWYVRPGLFIRSTFSARTLLTFVAPLSLYAVSMKLYEKLDLLTFKALGGTAAGAGIYSSAEGLTSLPVMMAAAFAPMLVSSLGASMKAGDIESAKRRGRKALHGMLLLVPLGGMLPGMSDELVGALYGKAFAGAATLFNVMIFASISLFIIGVVTSIMVSAEKPDWTFRIMGTMVLAQLLADLVVIPRMGAMGAAVVTTVCAIAGCAVSLMLVYRMWHIAPPLMAVLRSVAIAVVCYFAASAWSTPGPLVFLKFAVLTAGMAAAFWWFGDLPGMTGRRRSSPDVASA